MAIVLALLAALWLLPGSQGQWAAALGLLILVLWEFGPGRGKLHPFRVYVRPKWSAILANHDVIPQERVPDVIRRIASPDTSAQVAYSPLRNGISFTVLDVELGYRDDRHHFFTEVDIEEPIPEWEQPLPESRLDIRVSPTLYVTWTLDPLPGYEFGITTPRSKLKSHLPGDKEDRVELATLPSVALADYWDTVDAIRDRHRRAEKDAAIARCGWRRLESDNEDMLEPEPKCLEHKYFTIYHICWRRSESAES